MIEVGRDEGEGEGDEGEGEGEEDHFSTLVLYRPKSKSTFPKIMEITFRESPKRYFSEKYKTRVNSAATTCYLLLLTRKYSLRPDSVRQVVVVEI